MLDKAINHVIKATESRIKARWSFKEKRVWIVAKKLHPYPLNLKFKVWNEGEEDRGYEHYLVFLMKRRIKRLWCVFCVWREDKSSEFYRQRAGSQDVSFFILEVLGVFYSLSTNYEVVALGLGWGWSWHPWKDLDFQYLKRYGTRKSNGRIKSYGSGKLTVHRSVRWPGFHDISAVLTPILTHE